MKKTTEMVETIKYTAEDGKIFNTEEECIKHEAELKMHEFEKAHGDPPYHKVELLSPAGNSALDIFDNVLKSYFKIDFSTADSTTYYSIYVDSEQTKQWAQAFCEYTSKQKSDWGFEIGKKYIIYVEANYSLKYIHKTVHVTPYDFLINHYKKILEEIKKIFN